MTTQLTTCDVCGKHKQDTNHWFVVSPGGPDESIRIYTVMSGGIGPGMLDVCGESCLLRKISDLVNPPIPDRAA